jgi:hypothetical protein
MSVFGPDKRRLASIVQAISVVNRWLGRRCRSMRLARWSGRFPVVNGGSQPVLGCGSQFSCGLQCTAKKRVLRFLVQGDKAITVAAIELDTIANSAGLLTKHARAAGAADFDLVFHDGGSSNERGSIARGSLRNGVRWFDRRRETQRHSIDTKRRPQPVSSARVSYWATHACEEALHH